MKKIISLLLSVVCVCCMIGCAKGSVSDVKIDYGTSSIYSEDDMNEAIEIIKDKFNTGSWRGFELQSIAYSSDEKCNLDNLGWLRDLAEANHMSDEFTQCIMFESDFHTPENASAECHPDADYENYQWWLVRTDNSEWELLSWGYC